MTWTNNMSDKSEPEISSYTGENYTKVTFWPDFERFQMQDFEEDTLRLFEKRVYDLAAVINGKVSVRYNDEMIPVQNFIDYCKMYLEKDESGDTQSPLVQYTSDD